MKYFNSTFIVYDYTCNDYTGKIVQYQELQKVYACYCNNGDYHQMPSIAFELDKQHIQFDMDPADYMLMPYIDYDEPVMSKCILGIDGYKENQIPDSPVLTFGQRFLAKFSMMVVYNRAAGTVKVAIG